MGDLWGGGDDGDGGGGRPADPRVSPFGRRGAARDFPAIDQVLAYWSDLARGAGQVPQRKAVDPRALSGALPSVFLLESVAPGVARFRVAGSQICDLMGMEVRGMPLISIFAPKYRDEICEILQSVLDRTGQAQLVLAGESGYSRAPLEARMLILPLLDDYGRATRALGALEVKGQIGRTPRRFEIAAQKLSLLNRAELRPGERATGAAAPRTTDPSDRARGAYPTPAALPGAVPASSRPAAAAGFAESQARFEPPPPGSTTRRPWLRVIDGGKS